MLLQLSVCLTTICWSEVLCILVVEHTDKVLFLVRFRSCEWPEKQMEFQIEKPCRHIPTWLFYLKSKRCYF